MPDARWYAVWTDVSSQLRHVSTIWKKIVKQQYLLHMPHNMANVGPLTAKTGSGVYGSQANFNGFHILLLLLQRHRSLEANRTLHDVWLSPGLVHHIYTGGILPGAKFSLRQSLAFSYIGCITPQLSSSGRQPNFAAWYKEWSYGTFAEGTTYIQLGGHHIGHQPTFLFCLCCDTVDLFVWFGLFAIVEALVFFCSATLFVVSLCAVSWSGWTVHLCVKNTCRRIGGLQHWCYEESAVIGQQTSVSYLWR